MDWYYPVLGGTVIGDEARSHLAARRDEFVITSEDGEVLGVRCVSDKDWATAAETSECAVPRAVPRVERRERSVPMGVSSRSRKRPLAWVEEAPHGAPHGAMPEG